MKLEIISPSEIMYSGEADLVTLPGIAGKFTVLKNHASLISVLKEGKVLFRNSEGETEMDIKGGLADIDSNKIAVCVY